MYKCFKSELERVIRRLEDILLAFFLLLRFDTFGQLGVTTHFSEIIELKFGKKKLPYILCILKLF